MTFLNGVITGLVIDDLGICRSVASVREGTFVIGGQFHVYLPIFASNTTKLSGNTIASASNFVLRAGALFFFTVE